MINHILFICIGNICRSPMAEALLKAELIEHGLNISVVSAGLYAMVDRGADPMAQALMKKRGLDISHHRARQLTPDILFASDLIITMAADQKKQIEAQHPNVRGRVFRLGHHEGYDVIDPYQRMPVIFEQSLAQIEHGLGAWYKILFKNIQQTVN